MKTVHTVETICAALLAEEREANANKIRAHSSKRELSISLSCLSKNSINPSELRWKRKAPDAASLLRRCGAAALLSLFGGALGCTVSAQEPLEFELYVQGTEVSDRIQLSEDVALSLDRAELAFGPLYLCPGRQAGDLCDTARMEWREAAVVDALSPEKQHVGQLLGATGTTYSWMYDYGVTSLLTQLQPVVSPAVRELGQASVVLAGSVWVESQSIPWELRLLIQQEGDSGRGVSVVRKSQNTRFSHELSQNTESLTVRFDPSTWLAELPAELFYEHADCASGRAQVCEGLVEIDCTGGEPVRRDCSERGQVCMPSQGCTDSLLLEQDSTAAIYLKQELTAGEPPEFIFRERQN